MTRDRYPLSSSQQRLWFLNQADPADTAFHVPLVRRLRGALDVAALDRAVSTLVERHPVLATLIEGSEEEPRQRVLAADDPRYPALLRHDVRSGDGEAEVRELVALPFDLATEVPARVHLLRVRDDEHVLLVLLHHVATDGHSDAILLRDLVEAYNAGGRADREPPATTYGDYASWQRELLGERTALTPYAERMLARWREALEGVPHEIDIPRDPVGPDGHDRHEAWFSVPAEVGAALAEAARAARATPYMVVHAAVATLLARIGAGTDLPIGTVVAGRHDEALDEVVGFFNNPLVIRTRVAGGESFADVLQGVRRACLTAFADQELPFEWIVSAINPARGGRHPLYQVSVEYHRADDAEPAFDGLRAEPVPLRLTGAKLDLSWDFVERPDGGISVQISYDNTAYPAEFVDRLGDWTVRTLRAAAHDPGVRVDRVPLTSDEGEHRAAHAGLDIGLVERVRSATERHPDAPAVAGATALTYRELVGCADRLAGLLADAGVGRGTMVPLLAPRGAEAVAAFLAIRSLGATYLPLDHQAPLGRNAALLGQVGARLLLTTPATADGGRELAAAAGLPEPLVATAEASPWEALRPNAEHPDDTAYVIFTSGSTGAPKGAMVHARGMINNMLCEAEALAITGPELMASTAPLTFDISVWQMMTPLLFGGTVRPVDDETARSPMELFDLAARERWTVFQVVPSLLDAALDEWAAGHPTPGLAVRGLAVTGEALPPATCHRWARLFPEVPLVNCYGPTECSDDVTHAVIRAGDPVRGPRTPIGRATRGSRLYVLDPNLLPVPRGVPGELYVGGIVVGRGYLDDPRRTAATFTADPFAPDPGQRMYRTGDIVRRRADGQLEFCGRQDHQVKIRGRRIELGEVEHALRSVPGVSTAVVVVAAVAGTPALAGYWTGTAEVQRVRAELAGLLPPSLVPASLVRLPALPLTPNGKVDRAALPAPVPTRPAGRAPATDVERALCRAFAEVLLTRDVAADDDFFALGGHSLLVLKLVRAISAALGHDLRPTEVFESPTPEALAARVTTGATEDTTVAAMREDAVLPADVDPADAAPARTGPPSTVLLTGATGFFGAFLLRGLLDTTTARVLCLVRAADRPAAEARVRDTLTRYRLPHDDLARVEPIPGDLAAPRLGLDPAEFARLAGEVDLIVHNGAAVNFMGAYQALRGPNVAGTVEVLRLAATARVKPVHYVSTVDAVVGPSPVLEGARTAPEDVGHGGYERTKWVSERLVEAARARGVPASVHRPGRIGPSTTTGAVTTDDAFWHFVRACLVVGAAPSTTTPLIADPLIPVDSAAAVLVHIALSGPAAAGHHHIVGPTTTTLDQVLARAARRGHAIAEVPFAEWRTRVQHAARTSPDNAVKSVDLYLGEADDEPMAGAHAHDCATTDTALTGSGIARAGMDENHIDLCLAYLEDTGLLPTPAELVG